MTNEERGVPGWVYRLANRVPRWGAALVRGDSMLPTLRPDDRLLVSYRRVIQPDDLVVARFADGTLAVKRAEGRRTTPTGEAAWWLVSDNVDEGVDSRHRGPVRDDRVLAVVVARVWPRPRRFANRFANRFACRATRRL